MQQRLPSPELIHVAAAGENSGRVVLAARTGKPHAAAIAAAVTVARAFDASVETLLIECPDVLALTAHSFAREISYGGQIGALSAPALAAGQSAERRIAEKTILDALKAAGVPSTLTTVRAGSLEAIAEACRAQGPWNIVCLADAVGIRDGEWLNGLLGTVGGTTGVVCVGPCAKSSTGDVVVVVEDVERLTPMLRAAERLPVALARSNGNVPVIRLLLAGSSRDHTGELDGFVRLALPEGRARGGVKLQIEARPLNHSTHAELAEASRRIAAGFVVARAGGVAMPVGTGGNDVIAVLSCPLLLVR